MNIICFIIIKTFPVGDTWQGRTKKVFSNFLCIPRCVKVESKKNYFLYEPKVVENSEYNISCLKRRSSRPPNPPIGGAQANFGGPS